VDVSARRPWPVDITLFTWLQLYVVSLGGFRHVQHCGQTGAPQKGGPTRGQ